MPLEVDSEKYHFSGNFFPTGEIRRPGYKNLRGFIKMIKKQNKILQGSDTKVKFEVTLPIPR